MPVKRRIDYEILVNNGISSVINKNGTIKFAGKMFTGISGNYYVKESNPSSERQILTYMCFVIKSLDFNIYETYLYGICMWTCSLSRCHETRKGTMQKEM